MLPWCDQINALEGICTLQSCSGHGPDEHGYRSSGHLWLRLDQERSEAFRAAASDLSKQEGIEKVSVAHWPLGQEVVEIYFRGKADNQLETSLQTVVAFLSSL